LGVRQRFGILFTLEYDLTYPFRWELGGAGRSWNLGVGVEAGLALGGRQTEFGQAILFGFALDPFVELRLAPAAPVGVPIRATVQSSLADTSSYMLVVSAGLGIRWD